MKYKNILFIGFLILLSLFYTWYESRQPKPVDWSETYSPADKIPYGTYVVHHSLEQLFPHSEIKTSRFTLWEELLNWEPEVSGVYVFINESFMPDPVELDMLLAWVQDGNALFVAAEKIADTVLNTLSLKYNIASERLSSQLLIAGFKDQKYQFDSYKTVYFSLQDSFPGEILGIKEKEEYPDFLRIPYGKGRIFLNTNPRAFTNYYALDSINGDYYYKTLSCLPDPEGIVIWDTYYTLEQNGRFAPLRVILRYPALKWGLYLLMTGALLYMLFRAKRQQRPIPLLLPLRNRMIEFAVMVSSLYYKKKDHTSIALKRIDFFLEEVRFRFLLRTDVLDGKFIRLLSEHSGIEEQKTGELIQLILKIKDSGRADEDMLVALMRGTELFLK